MFADLDLRSSAEVIPVRQYPSSLPDDVAAVRADGWFYCGALENFPEILQRMLDAKGTYGPLLGTTPDALKLVRDPFWLSRTLQSSGIPVLDAVDSSSPPHANGLWLQKPLASAGGRLIRVWDEVAARVPFLERHYFQRRVCGQRMSALFHVERGQAEWLGMSSELQVHREARSPTEFSYCGSIGPAVLEDADNVRVRKQLNLIASRLVETAPGLNGLIGLDFRLQEGIVWLTEVNPRYTASIEVLELAGRRSLLNRASGDPSMPLDELRSPHRLVAKQIVYARTTQVAPDLSRFLSTSDPWQPALIADIPVPGSVIETGWPVCTVLAAANSQSEVEMLLRERLRLVESSLEQTVNSQK